MCSSSQYSCVRGIICRLGCVHQRQLQQPAAGAVHALSLCRAGPEGPLLLGQAARHAGLAGTGTCCCCCCSLCQASTCKITLVTLTKCVCSHAICCAQSACHVGGCMSSDPCMHLRRAHALANCTWILVFTIALFCGHALPVTRETCDVSGIRCRAALRTLGAALDYL